MSLRMGWDNGADQWVKLWVKVRMIRDTINPYSPLSYEL